MDVLKVIDGLRNRLWTKYGNVLDQKYTQLDIHMTYYAGEVLQKNGYDYVKIDDKVFYTEKAMHAAFIAGLRVGRMDAEQMAIDMTNERVYDAIQVLRGIQND